MWNVDQRSYMCAQVTGPRRIENLTVFVFRNNSRDILGFRL